jgi:hypothetical protein
MRLKHTTEATNEAGISRIAVDVMRLSRMSNHRMTEEWPPAPKRRDTPTTPIAKKGSPIRDIALGTVAGIVLVIADLCIANRLFLALYGRLNATGMWPWVPVLLPMALYVLFGVLIGRRRLALGITLAVVSVGISAIIVILTYVDRPVDL